MADLVVMPPVDGCDCAMCRKRHHELACAYAIEWELYVVAQRDLPSIRGSIAPPVPRSRRKWPLKRLPADTGAARSARDRWA